LVQVALRASRCDGLAHHVVSSPPNVPSKVFNYFLDRIHIDIGSEQGDILDRLLQLCEPVENAALKERYHSIAVGQWLC
jgi:hypothetical protein